MTRINQILSVLILLSILASCQSKKLSADMVILNANIYTVNEDSPKAQAVVVCSDTISFVGTSEDAKKWIGDSTRVIDLMGKTMTPGLIEGHGHFLGMGKNLINLNLQGTKSFDEIVELVEKKVNSSSPGEWIIGRGWHQDKWDGNPEKMIGGFPSHDRISEVSPENPIYLAHASGHAALVNSKAMEIAGIDRNTATPEGGEIFQDMAGNPTGILNETAQDLVEKIIPKDTEERNRKALMLAFEECHKNGITSFHDAGTDSTTIELLNKLGANGELSVRLYTMLSGANKALVEAYVKHGPVIAQHDNFLTIRSIKLYSDGALGSRGALLLHDYSDAPGVLGLRIHQPDYMNEIAKLGYSGGFQICTHAIGDRANREVLDLYEEIYSGDSNPQNLRFRIEHAQHIAEDDIPRFGQLGVIPSMQAIHMSSDRPWAIDRLGKKRIDEGAYVWNKLIDTGATIVNGTDVPVEPLNPIACFYASVSRQTLAGSPDGGYEPEQKMSREEALKSYTINNAYGAFEEDIKGSIEVGKLADFTVFSQDIMEVPIDQLLKTQVDFTIIGGEVVFERE